MSDHDDVTDGGEGPGGPIFEIDGPSDVVAPTVTTSSPRRRLLVLGAVVALLVGVVALADQGDGPPDEDDEDGEEDTEVDVEPTVLQLAGPRDGNDSIGLPIQVDPAADLEDGQVVTATSGGFVPGESVGIVQCADALPDEPGNAIDLCNIDGYTNVTASTDGIATGTYAVRKVLVTPRSGAVDCAVEVRRCFIAMGALNDYDRSGGVEIELRLDAPGGEATAPPPPAVVGPPAMSAIPSLGLTDGDVVQLTASGLVEGERLEVSLCADDPEVCWPLVGPEPSGDDPQGLVVTAGGYLDVSLQVWRFLPGPRPGTYVDCSVSQCRIHLLAGGPAPDPLVLGFSNAAAPPTGPWIDVEPREDLAPDEPFTVTGAGFPAGPVLLELCELDGSDVTAFRGCTRLTPENIVPDPDGGFVIETSGRGDTDAAPSTTVACDATTSTTATESTETTDPCRDPTPAGGPALCAEGASCVVRATTIGARAYGRPTFVPAPVPVSFSSGD